MSGPRPDAMTDPEAGGRSITPRLRRAWRLLKQLTGESRWDDYVEACRREGREPMTRREFERHRDGLREGGDHARCC